MQVSTIYLCGWGHYMGVCQAMTLIGDPRQATSEGKSGLVETGVTGPAAKALLCVHREIVLHVEGSRVGSAGCAVHVTYMERMLCCGWLQLHCY